MKKETLKRLIILVLIVLIPTIFFGTKLNTFRTVNFGNKIKQMTTENEKKELIIDPATTALVLIDLQKGIVAMPTAPYTSGEVIANTNKLLDKFHLHKAPAVIVKVAFNNERSDALNPMVDEPLTSSSTALPADWSTIVDEVKFDKNDIFITKHQWGAFYGTELDLQLRRRGIKTIVIGGIATNYGVESTARDGYERGYQMVFAEDAMASRLATDHEFAIKRIFPRIGLVRTTEEILKAMK